MYLEMVYYFMTYYPYRYETLACQVVGDCLARVLKKEKKTYQFFFFYNLLFRTLITILMCTVFALSASIVVMHAGGGKNGLPSKRALSCLYLYGVFHKLKLLI